MFKFEWDLSEFERFSANLNDGYGFDTAMMTAVQKIARTLHKFLLIQTPIDTGNLRKMWSAGNNLYFTVEPIAGGYQVTLYNFAQNEKGERYGIWVNDGHRTPNGTGWVMGRFFVERSVIQTEAQVERIIMRELQKWWNGV